MKMIRTLFAVSALLFAGQAHSAAITPADLLGQATAKAQASFNGLGDDLAAATWMNPSNSAEAHSAGLIPVGVQIGLELATLTIDPNAPQWSSMSGGFTDTTLPFPRVRLSVGIPFGLDFAYMTLSSSDLDIDLTGYEGRFALGSFIPVPFMEANVRYHQSTLTVGNDMEISNSGFAAMIGADFPIVKPYIEFGTVSSTSTPSGALSVLAEHSTDRSTLTYGAKIQLMFLVLNLEQSTVGDQELTTAKLAFEF
ncbi:MAG: hypothetical protein R8M45_05900 [Ghiorsea sp.]